MRERAGSSSLTAVVAALPEEMRPLYERLAGVEVRRLRTLDARLAHVGGRPVALVVGGDGDGNARVSTEEILSRLPVARLLVIGVAGALTPDLEPGALVLADQVRSDVSSDAIEDRVLAPPSALVRWAARVSGARRGRVVSAAALADTPAEKARLAARHAGAGPAVVDLESMACAEVAAAAGVPWLVLRAVSDTAAEALPALLERCRDEAGAVRRGRVARALLRNPGALPPLLALRRRTLAGARALAPAIQSLLDAWPALDEGVPVPRTWTREELHE